MTSAVAMPELLEEHGLGDGAVLRQVLERAADRKHWDRCDAQLRSTHGCRRPARLRGNIDPVDVETGECHPVYRTDVEPDATLLKCRGNRREAVCPSCAETYRANAVPARRGRNAGRQGRAGVGTRCCS